MIKTEKLLVYHGYHSPLVRSQISQRAFLTLFVVLCSFWPYAVRFPSLRLPSRSHDHALPTFHLCCYSVHWVDTVCCWLVIIAGWHHWHFNGTITPFPSWFHSFCLPLSSFLVHLSISVFDVLPPSSQGTKSNRHFDRRRKTPHYQNLAWPFTVQS